MRIIKKGEMKKYRAECPRCRSIIGFEFSDMQEEKFIYDFNRWDYSLICPRCGQNIPIRVVDNTIYPHA